MKTIIKYKCDCGKEYETAEEALNCEERHQHEFEINSISPEADMTNFPVRIWISNKSSGKSCEYHITESDFDHEWKLWDDICNDIHLGDRYLVKTFDTIDIIMVTTTLSNPNKLHLTNYNTQKDIREIDPLAICCKITIPNEEEEHKIICESCREWMMNSQKSN